MNLWPLLFLVCFETFSLPFVARAEDFKVPTLTGPVMDQVGVLDSGTKRELETLLFSLNQKSKAQLQVLVLESLQGVPIENVSIKIVDEWKLGDKKKDNGILFLIARRRFRGFCKMGGIRGLRGTNS